MTHEVLYHNKSFLAEITVNILRNLWTEVEQLRLLVCFIKTFVDSSVKDKLLNATGDTGNEVNKVRQGDK